MKLGEIVQSVYVDNTICEKAEMSKPNLLDVVELTADLPDDRLSRGSQGTIVERYADGAYEVEFTDEDGETIALCTVTPDQIRMVQPSVTSAKRHIVQKLLTTLNALDTKQTEEVLNFADSLRTRQAAVQR